MTTKYTPTQFSTQAKAYLRKNSNGMGEVQVDSRDQGPVTAYVFNFTNDSGGTLASGTYIELGKLGPGRLLPISTISTSAWGTSRTLSLGYNYFKDRNGDEQNGNDAALISGLSVASATNTTLQASGVSGIPGDGLVLDYETTILAKVGGGTLPSNGTLSTTLFMLR